MLVVTVSSYVAAAPSEPVDARALDLVRKLGSSGASSTDLATPFAWVDYSDRPGGGRNQIERGACTAAGGLDDVRDGLAAAAAQIDAAVIDQAVRCTPHDKLVYCEVNAREAGEATLTLAIAIADGHARLVGFSRHETFQVDGRKDEARRDRAFAKLRACRTAVAGDPVQHRSNAGSGC